MFRNDRIITVEIDKIEHETEDSYLIQYSGCSIWLKKSEILIEQKEGKLFVNLPMWLHDEKFWHDSIKYKNKWSRKFDKCIRCGTIERRHLGRGLCAQCYQRNIESKSKHRKQDRIRGHASSKLTKKFIIEEYFENKKSLLDIANKCGCSRAYVAKKAKEYNIPLRTKKSAREIALNDGKLEFERIDENGNIKKVILQKIIVNENFFSEWSERMAYVLGIIFTDGTIDPGSRREPSRKSSKIGRLSIAQKEPELLEKIKALMNCNAKLYFSDKKKYGKIIAGELYRFQIHSDKIYDDLINLELTPRKSLTIGFPSIPLEFTRHFIRGCWDGDGGIWYDSNKIFVTVFTSGSKIFIEGLHLALINAGLPKKKIYCYNNSYHLKYTGHQVTQLYEYLYKNVSADMYLERKHELFKEAY